MNSINSTPPDDLAYRMSEIILKMKADFTLSKWIWWKKEELRTDDGFCAYLRYFDQEVASLTYAYLKSQWQGEKVLGGYWWFPGDVKSRSRFLKNLCSEFEYKHDLYYELYLFMLKEQHQSLEEE